MKMEIKILILSLLMSFAFVGVFTYIVNSTQKDFYVLQVGIYAKEENKNEKIDNLIDLGVKADYYNKDDKFYVFTFLSDDKQEVEAYKNEYKIDGIIKTYHAYYYEGLDDFLQRLKDGEV